MTTTATKTPDQLRQQAQAAAMKAAEAQALVDVADAAERAKELEAQADRDRAFLDSYSVREQDQRVADTRAALREAMRELSITQALAAHMAAINARSWAYADAQAAAGRLGRSTAGMTYPDTTMPVLMDEIVATAQRMAQDLTDADRASKEH